jgi:hypothetical protein
VLQIYHGIPQRVAAEHANAVQGLKPQIFAMSGDDPSTMLARLLTGLQPVLNLLQKKPL